MTSNYKFEIRAQLDIAVDLWLDDETSAIETYGDINTWDVSEIDDFSNLFSTTRNKSSSTFNADIGNWDVGNGKNFLGMFFKAQIFNQDISGWNVSSGWNFSSMLAYTASFNQDIGDWDVSNGEYFVGMFTDAYNFNQDLSSWDVSNGINFSWMFNNAYQFSGGKISNWDVSKGDDFTRMFAATRYFVDNLSYWNPYPEADFTEMFYAAWHHPWKDQTPINSSFLGITIIDDLNKDTLIGDKGNDVLSGLDGNDEIKGGDGWDKIMGGAGDDNLDGEEKEDTAIYTGQKDNYLITEDNSIFIVQDLRDDSPDGKDTLTNIEFIKFSDQVLPLNKDIITGQVYTPDDEDEDITTQSFNLDVDGNGKVSALGDGLMVIRKLFGAAFDGDKLTAQAISNDATRTTDEIHTYIQDAIYDKTLDVDGDSSVTALGDGLIIIRKLFGAAFDGDKLTTQAISNDATRTTDEIHKYIAAMTDFDSAV